MFAAQRLRDLGAERGSILIAPGVDRMLLGSVGKSGGVAASHADQGPGVPFHS
jgi:hypothetical protein